MTVELNGVAVTDRLVILREILLLVVNDQIVEVIVEPIRQMLQRIGEVNDRRVFVRCLELECEMLIQVIVHIRMRVLSVRQMANLDRVAVAVNRIYRQVQSINGLTVVMRRIHRRMIADRVIDAGRGQNTVVEAVDITFTNMFVQVYMERIGITHFPRYDTVAFIRTVVMDDGMMLHVLPCGDGDHGIRVVARLLDPRIFVRPEQLYRVALT